MIRVLAREGEVPVYAPQAALFHGKRFLTVTYLPGVYLSRRLTVSFLAKEGKELLSRIAGSFNVLLGEI